MSGCTAGTATGRCRQWKNNKAYRLFFPYKKALSRKSFFLERAFWTKFYDSPILRAVTEPNSKLKLVSFHSYQTASGFWVC